MKIRVADFIADYLLMNNITHVFTVTGGGAMHLNNGFGHKEGLTCVYNHHEQACAMAAEAYARVNNKIAAVCVTTGPGGTNAITGVLGGWLDSIPMLIISGQVRYDVTARSTGLKLRALGDQEFDIVQSVSCMTKYAVMVTEPESIKYHLDKALYLAKSGRPGPCWLDIPLDVQGAIIDTDDLLTYAGEEDWSVPCVTDDVAIEILEKIKRAKRPVLNVGNGIRISGAYNLFREVAEKLQLPIVTGWDSIDLIPDDNPLYVGRAGIMGDRAGNWAIQNSDLVLSIGSRLSIRQVGYDKDTWAREAYTIVNDIDCEELKKPTIRVDMPIWADAKDLLDTINKKLPNTEKVNRTDWLSKCAGWKHDYPVVQEKHYAQKGLVNVYAFIGKLSAMLTENQLVVVGNGSACVVGSHAFKIKEGQRFLINSGAASMGYDLPAAIGACIANGKEGTICITGDGSIQMNIQELQTIVHHQLPIGIFLINNGGYHSIRQTQRNYFNDSLVGVGVDSYDLSFPDIKKIAFAYGIDYYSITDNANIGDLGEILLRKKPFLCEIMVDTEQEFEPKSSSKRTEKGQFVAAPLEDLAPFLPRKELEKQMIIPLLND